MKYTYDSIFNTESGSIPMIEYLILSHEAYLQYNI